MFLLKKYTVSWGNLLGDTEAAFHGAELQIWPQYDVLPLGKLKRKGQSLKGPTYQHSSGHSNPPCIPYRLHSIPFDQ